MINVSIRHTPQITTQGPNKKSSDTPTPIDGLEQMLKSNFFIWHTFCVGVNKSRNERKSVNFKVGALL